jgi:hypothetical protein
MTNPMVRIYTDSETFIDREMNADELKQHKIDAEKFAIEQSARQEAQNAKAAAMAKLEALGLSSDDLKALGL